MRQTRVLVSELPRMMRDIVEGAVESQSDMTLVGTCREADLDRAVGRHRADVVVMRDGRLSTDRVCRQLLLAHPRTRLVVITREGRAARVYQLRRSEVVDLSPASLIEAIRASVRDED